MTSNIKIDTDLLNEKVLLLKNDLNDLNIALENIEKSVDKIPSIWSSDTCDEVMTNLEKYTNKFDDIRDTNDKYASFLDDIVSGDYTSLNNNLDTLIDDKIAVD